MANANNPQGFQLQQSAIGAPSNFEHILASIAYNDTTKIFTGDPVKLLTTGFVSQWTSGTSVAQLWGIFAGVEYLSVSQGKMVSAQFWPGADVASTGQNSIVAKLIPCIGSAAPLFLVQSDSTGTAFADIGTNVDVALGTGNTFTGQSGAYIVSTPATTATLPFQVVGLYGGVPGAGGRMGIQPSATNPYGGSATGAYNRVIVRANVVGAGGAGLA